MQIKKKILIKYLNQTLTEEVIQDQN